MKISANKILLIWALATFIALFFVGQSYFYVLTVGKEIEILDSLIWELGYYYTWALLLFGIIPIANNYLLEFKNIYRNLPIHIISGIVFAILHRGISFITYLSLVKPGKLVEGMPIWFNPKIVGGSFNSFINYFVIIGVYYGVSYYKKFREQKLHSSQLETQLANAQLQALRMQLQPHFLFNTLHAISSLMDENVQKARHTLTLLSQLLRQSLDNIGKQFITLREELEFLKNYLEIEQTRFQERLTVSFEIEDDTLDLKIPNLLLQPIVENAVKHGVAPKAEGGSILIKSWTADDRLFLAVKDDGNGCKEIKNKGIGLANVEDRLQKLYGEKSSFEMKNGEGFEVTISISIESMDIS
ncbi:MAG: histidine kinase [Bacteroidetes bacterium]|nr:histidine kinase [Bacteroidota bacterium]